MPNPADPLSNVIYNLQIHRGVGGDRKLLSCNGNGEVVDLWPTDDDSHRQRWKLTKQPDGTYVIQVYGGVSGNRKFLSTNGDGTRVDLWSSDDGSGRQRWVLEPLQIGCFRIRVKTGVSGARKYLSTNGNGTRVDLWNTDDNSGRQHWLLMPEKIEITSIEFHTGNGIAGALPSFVSKVVITNNTAIQQSTSVTFEEKATESSSYEHKHGFKFEVSGTKNFGTPGFVGGSITVTASTSNTWTYGQSQTREDTRTYHMPVNAPPMSRVTASATVILTKLEVPYTATGYSKVTGQPIQSSGVWRGVAAGAITYAIDQSPL